MGVNQKGLHIGYFSSEIGAASAADRANLALRGWTWKTNLEKTDYAEDDVKHMLSIIDEKRNRQFQSPYKGVSRLGEKWRSELRLGGITVHYGLSCTQLEAAQKYDDALRTSGAPRAFILRSLNFRREKDYFCETTWHEEPIPEGVHSRFIGVTWVKKYSKFKAQSRLTFLGYFDSELAAARSFDEHSLRVNGPTNFRPK